jgi:hypothetical protein
MDLDKFYDNVILRDVLQYTLPGGVVVTSAMIIVDTILAQLNANYSFFANLSTVPLWQVFILLAISYMIGHVLTAFDTHFFRDDESKQTGEIIKRSEWLKGKLVKVFAKYTETTTADMEQLIQETPNVTTLREIGRAIIHKNQQELYREFINRHSIFSLLFKNMAIALAFFLLSLILSSIINWNSLSKVFSTHVLLAIFISTTLIVLICGTIWLLNERSRKIRSTMIKHTFQIFYADYIMSQISKKNTND